MGNAIANNNLFYDSNQHFNAKVVQSIAKIVKMRIIA